MNLSALQSRAADNQKNLEILAHAIVLGSDPGDKIKGARGEYLKKLSAGGKACFLVNRRDYQEALSMLETCPAKDSGSGEYVRAMCLEGLEKHKESVAAFERARAKIGSTFNPSAVFYLQFATPYYRLGDYDNSLKYLELARTKETKPLIPLPKAESALSFAVARRSLVVQEKKGQAKESFDKYVAIFGSAQGQLHLNDPITASPEVVARAKAWLAKNKAPADAHPVEQAKFYLTTGKAYIAAGDLNAAKAALAKASEMIIPDLVIHDKRVGDVSLAGDRFGAPSKDKKPDVKDNMVVSHNALVKINDQASVLLVRLYVKEKNYAEACKYLRKTFANDPAENFLMSCNVIHFKDVPELVTQQDLALHSNEVEQRLEHFPLVVMGLQSDIKAIIKAIKPMIEHPLLAKARKQIEQLQYADCLKSLDEYLAIYNNERPATTKTQAEADMVMRGQQIFRISILKMSVAFAANRRDVALSLGRNLEGDNALRLRWKSVIAKLEGSKEPLSAFDIQMQKDYPTLIDWGNYAAGIRFMKLGDHKAAAAEFAKIAPGKGKDSTLHVYAVAMKKFCDKQKK